ncbi:MAG TPA: TldD/PmbA family protein [Gemmatimonadaceae bacterium]
MTIDRRDFLRHATRVAALGAIFPRSMLPRLVRVPPPAGWSVAVDPDPAALAATAVDAARGAGAAYADVRLTFRQWRGFGWPPSELEEMGMGARALVNGYWGFASTPYWTPDEAARVGREAVAQAKANALGTQRVVELGTIPRVSGGEWSSPMQVDPFALAPGEVADWMDGLRGWASELGGGLGINWTVGFVKERRTFASSEGSTWGQTFHTTSASVGVDYKERRWGLDFLGPAQGGWEIVQRAPVRDGIRRIKEAIDEDVALPEKPVEVGRYAVLFDVGAMAALLAQTIGYATELDRALGYEANAGGTSYLNDPLAMLGSYRAGAPALTVTANRGEPGALATVRWDDEGVAPESFTLVKDGVLADFQTTRESAAWLAPWYEKTGRPARSHGCASAPSALDLTMQHTPNLALQPGAGDADFDALLAGMPDGLAIRQVRPEMDQQHSSGVGLNTSNSVYEVKRGKRVAVVKGAGMLFRATDLWRNLTALAGAKSLRWLPAGQSEKGEPSQTTPYSLGVVPGVFKDITIVDIMRKA